MIESTLKFRSLLRSDFVVLISYHCAKKIQIRWLRFQQNNLYLKYLLLDLMIIKFTSYWLLIIALVTTQSCLDLKEEVLKPNILFISIDDLRPTLGVYGDTIAITPNIDQFASEGMTFRKAYCQAAVCAPSRASLMTGIRPDSTRVWHLGDKFREIYPSTVTMPQHFSKHGDHTELVDLFPSLCELAGIDIPEYMQGISFIPLLNKPKLAWKHAAFSQFHRRPKVSADGKRYMGYSINTEKYHYIEWYSWDHKTGTRGELTDIELYDSVNDPHETANIASSPKLKVVQTSLSKELADGWRKALPSVQK